jgi:hypothetical protein
VQVSKRMFAVMERKKRRSSKFKNSREREKGEEGE